MPIPRPTRLRTPLLAAALLATAAAALVVRTTVSQDTAVGQPGNHTHTTHPRTEQPGSDATGGTPTTEAGRDSASRSPGGSRNLAGWTVTVYYTAVQRFHRGSTTAVTGCPRLECSNGNASLGTYPTSFVEAVRSEGTGLTRAGRYLNWSYDTGFWLDEAPRDSGGRALRPFESAAADPDVLPRGTRLTIRACGRDEDGQPIDRAVCTRLRAAAWTVTDEFTPGLGGQRHIDVYIGEETGPGFTDSSWYTTLVGAGLRAT